MARLLPPPFAAALLAGAALLLAGCATIPTGGATHPPRAGSTATGEASTGPSGGTGTGTGSGGSGAGGGSTSTTGCPAGGGAIPAGAATAPVEDVDSDGRPDTEFFTQSAPFEFGVRTASGATITTPDDVAGPGRHSGWISHRETGVVAEIDDGRTATYHAFIDCAFVRTTTQAGAAFSTYLGGFSSDSTGVRCTDGNGGALLWRDRAVRQGDGSYNVYEADINLVDGGRIAEVGPEYTLASKLTATDPQTTAAMRSSCGDVPIVGTSGRD